MDLITALENLAGLKETFLAICREILVNEEEEWIDQNGNPFYYN